jgi:hypothetical protein
VFEEVQATIGAWLRIDRIKTVEQPTDCPYIPETQTVIETDTYIGSAKSAGMTDVERKAAIDIVSANPIAGDLIVGSGGCRRLGVAGRGKGKSGGYRVITVLLLAFSKAPTANLTDAQVNALAKSVKAIPASFD